MRWPRPRGHLKIVREALSFPNMLVQILLEDCVRYPYSGSSGGDCVSFQSGRTSDNPTRSGLDRLLARAQRQSHGDAGHYGSDGRRNTSADQPLDWRGLRGRQPGRELQSVGHRLGREQPLPLRTEQRRLAAGDRSHDWNDQRGGDAPCGSAGNRRVRAHQRRPDLLRRQFLCREHGAGRRLVRSHVRKPVLRRRRSRAMPPRRWAAERFRKWTEWRSVPAACFTASISSATRCSR
jgi:hypothetical protein